jgi:predicted GIY-YIG superfamily endonuclease
MKVCGYNVLPSIFILTEMTTQLYRHFDKNNNLLYVGISLSTFHRLSQHRDHSGWFYGITNVTIEHFDKREDALAAERKAIKSENPKFNIASRKTVAEIEKEQKEQTKLTQLAMAEKFKLFQRFIEHQLTYKLDDLRNILNMTSHELNRHVAEGRLSTFEVEGRVSTKTNEIKMKTMVSGWALIDFINYLENK